MKKTTSVFLTLFFLFTILPAAHADLPRQNAICELYSVDGYYEDDVGNRETYSYHVPQINDKTSAAVDINAEIAKNVAKSLSDRNREFAKKLKARNRPIEEIVEDTGLTEEEVKAL